MKKYIFFTLAFALLVSSAAFAGVVDVRFVNGNMTDDAYCVTVEIKAQDIDFEIGSATIFFEYNTAAITNPSHTPINFSDNNLCAAGGAASAYTNSFNALQTGTKGEGNYAILLKQPYNGCPSVTAEWIAVAEYCFEVVDATVSPDLKVNTRYTAFNTVDNLGDQHSIGTVEGIESALGSLTETPAETIEGIKVFPNLTANHVTVEFMTEQAAEVNITVFDVSGRTMATTQYDAAKGTFNEQVDLSSYSSGYYLIEVDNGLQKVSEKVLLNK